MVSRREFGKLAVNLAAAAIPLSRLHAAKKINSTIHGVASLEARKCFGYCKQALA